MTEPPRDSVAGRAHGRGRFSLSFNQPLGTLIEPDSIAGYYVDFRVKAPTPSWPPSELERVEEQLFVALAQRGLGAYEHFLHEGDERWLDAALGVGAHLLDRQEEGGEWFHQRPYPHTFDLQPPWLSAMAQGEGASLLIRLHRTTGEERFADAAHRALTPLTADSAEGGVRATLDGGPFYEEYPTRPPSYVLNGGIFALWGLRDVALGLDDEEVRRDFEEGVDALAASIDRYDLGWWSLYDLFPHRVPNVASFAYHELHIDQLRAMMLVAPRPQLGHTLERFESYATSHRNMTRAFAAKVCFRLFVPRRER